MTEAKSDKAADKKPRDEKSEKIINEMPRTLADLSLKLMLVPIMIDVIVVREGELKKSNPELFYEIKTSLKGVIEMGEKSFTEFKSLIEKME